MIRLLMGYYKQECKGGKYPRIQIRVKKKKNQIKKYLIWIYVRKLY